MNTPSTMATLQWIAGPGVLIALLLTAAWIDWRTMRIPNWLTVLGLAWGMAFNVATSATLLDGLIKSFGGIGIAFALFLPLWLLRAMGAGDVKLMAAVGSFLGAAATFASILFIGMVGGVMVIAFAMTHRIGGQLARNLRDIAYSAAVPGMPLARPTPSTKAGKLPYGVAISTGTVLFLLLHQMGWV